MPPPSHQHRLLHRRPLRDSAGRSRRGYDSLAKAFQDTGFVNKPVIYLGEDPTIQSGYDPVTGEDLGLARLARREVPRGGAAVAVVERAVGPPRAAPLRLGPRVLDVLRRALGPAREQRADARARGRVVEQQRVVLGPGPDLAGRLADRDARHGAPMPGEHGLPARGDVAVEAQGLEARAEMTYPYP